MPKMTKQATLVKYHELAGYKQVESRSTKYICMTKGSRTVWMGKAGALRIGRTASASSSQYIDPKTWARIEAKVAEAHEEAS